MLSAVENHGRVLSRVETYGYILKNKLQRGKNGRLEIEAKFK